MSTLTVSLVSVNGRIDQAASTEAFTTALSKHIAEVEVESALIGEAVASIFEQYKGQALPMPAVSGMAAQKLNATPENYAVLTKRVSEYLRGNSQDPLLDKSDLTTSLFVIARGPNGGCRLRADMPVKSV
jgi:hypothetical protein